MNHSNGAHANEEEIPNLVVLLETVGLPTNTAWLEKMTNGEYMTWSQFVCGTTIKSGKEKDEKELLMSILETLGTMIFELTKEANTLRFFLNSIYEPTNTKK